ncbi:hypothetical protein B0H16DRAFT_1741595 [Mycena metata]|uniref:RING-type domain-containing protein n=1 Tax=Mycena metata TaxID=1033252 RepID=A0AAD7H9W2_9AGAR|nr:hypothetical protein B0H16DRAFT_1741595 [Mycena metata]
MDGYRRPDDDGRLFTARRSSDALLMSSRRPRSLRIDLDSPRDAVRTTPLITRIGGPQITSFTPEEWQLQQSRRQRALRFASTTVSTLRRMRASSPRCSLGIDVVSRLGHSAAYDASSYTFQGRRVVREAPLDHDDLYIGQARPPQLDPAYEEQTCVICMGLKSHPVSYICGHGHCYVCIRLWLEHDWGCPECRITMTVPPFRVFTEDKIIARMHGAWDLSTVDYSWEGLEFPYMLPSDSDDI